MHLPAFAAAAGGLFADHHLDVTFVDGQGRPASVAAGGADFGLTAVLYLHQELAADRGLGVRFVGGLHRRHPIAALVREDSPVAQPGDLPGRTAADWSLRFMAPEYAAALGRLGLDRPRFVRLDDGADPSEAVRAGQVEVIPTWVDTLPVRTRHGVALRAVPVGGDICASGLVAADRVPEEVAGRMRDALAAGLVLQREDPRVGVVAFAERTGLPHDYVAQGWALFEPCAGEGPSPLTMTAAEWERTVASTAAVHGLPVVDGEQVHRPAATSPAPAL
ncbi:MAG TPA: ABC transporter substrate-binding protein [Nitriliruptorales bacterium]|nr:ABC transporter substrate-binding protein [Nitriliruptorales bacterium]